MHSRIPVADTAEQLPYNLQVYPSPPLSPHSNMATPDFYLHQLLRYYQHDVAPGHVSPLLWDLREKPDAARRVVNLDETITPIQLSQLATSPPIIVLHINCEIFPGDWPIEIRRLEGITVGDVLEGIHSALQRQIRRDEWDGLSEKQRGRIELVFENRCKMDVDRDECRRGGVLRVDCLLQHTWFAGLSVSPDQDCTCILTLRRPK